MPLNKDPLELNQYKVMRFAVSDKEARYKCFISDLCSTEVVLYLSNELFAMFCVIKGVSGSTISFLHTSMQCHVRILRLSRFTSRKMRDDITSLHLDSKLRTMNPEAKMAAFKEGEEKWKAIKFLRRRTDNPYLFTMHRKEREYLFFSKTKSLRQKLELPYEYSENEKRGIHPFGLRMAIYSSASS
ncbi:hypothetical protein NPIL_97731 [Nephila pilipes]|uniref:Uncharacterized protein n=1 Tax=Nephila pilipes TaxID=299642 RepID=A0A8X6UQD8_NEPPI|nr:hypothetical protein NPIL_97731 [Nephila pilipes]